MHWIVEEWTGRIEAAFLHRGQRRTGTKKTSPPFFPVKIKIFIIPAAIYNDTSLFKCIENVPCYQVIHGIAY